MEKNSFESKLQELVREADQIMNTGDEAKERVWNKVKPKGRRPTWYWVAAVAAVLLGIIGTFYQPKKEVSVAARVLKGKPTDTKKQISEAGPITKEKRIPSTQDLSKRIKPTQKASTLTNLPAPVLTGIQTKPITADEPPIAVIITLPEKILSTPVHQEATAEFTVQFKRGKPANSASNGSLTTMLKTFKLRKDTSYLANSEEKQPTKIKLSFKTKTDK